MNERPVIGSCEQCARQYDLLIPEPGSGDLEFDRVDTVFRWCSGCGMFVGRACCWNADAVACVRCAASPPITDAAEPALPDLTAARSAVRALEAANAALVEVEQGLDAVADQDREQALNSWEDAWLATGALMARAESCRVAAASHLDEISPSAEAESGELSRELQQLLDAHEAQSGSLSDRLVSLGREVAGRDESPRTASTPEPVAALAIAAPATTAVPVVTIAASAVSAPAASAERAKASEPAEATAPEPAAAQQPAIAAPWPAADVPQPPANAVPDVAPAVAPAVAAAPSAHRVRGRSVVTITPIVINPPASPAYRPGPVPGRRHLVATLFVIGLLLLAVGVVSGAMERLGGGPGSNAAGDATATPEVPGAGGAGSGSLLPSEGGTPAATASEVLAGVVGFDLHNIGLLEGNGAPITRAIGAPEVVPFPSPFDRSVRLEGADSGLCLDTMELTAGASTLHLDLHLGEVAPAGALGFSFATADTDAEPAGFGLDLADLGELSPDTWYRLSVTWDGASSADLVVSRRDGGAAILEMSLTHTDAAALDSAGEICLRASQVSSESSIFVDNLRVDQ